MIRARRRWRTADYDKMSWHDNHVHGLQIESGRHGTGKLILDLDYITEWLGPADGRYRFRIAPCTLTFVGVFGLQIELDWKTVGAGMTPFSMSGIGREKLDYPKGSRWSIGVNWPEGFITFESTGFTQAMWGITVETHRQSLEPRERRPLDGK
jgi:hypothetical protein